MNSEKTDNQSSIWRMLGGYLKINLIKMRLEKGQQGRGLLKKSLHTEG